MKRIVTLLIVLALLGMMTACSSDKVTMKQLLEANRSETLLGNYDSVYIQVELNGEEYVEYYHTEEFSYEKSAAWSRYLTDEIAYLYENGQYKRWIQIDRNGLVGYADYRVEEYGDLVLSEDSLKEKIQSVTENQDHITVACSMDAKIFGKLVGSDAMTSFDSEYVVAADDYRVLTGKATITYEGGDPVVFDVDCTYNAEMPEGLQQILACVNQTEDLRTVTLVFQAGTEKENVEILQVPKGAPVTIGLAEGSAENYSFYRDEACTELHTDTGEYDADVTIYIQWNS